jgi:hypothetical protein
MIVVGASRVIQIFDLNSSASEKDINGYVLMLNKELKLLLEVLTSSPHRIIDLTPAFLISVDVIQQSVYRQIKHLLAFGLSKYTTSLLQIITRINFIVLLVLP